MALRIVKRRATGSNSLDYGVVTAKLAADITGLLPFPPAAAAASIVLTILETVRDVKSNQQDCARLSRRAARLLVDLGNRMEGKWDTAPEALVENVREFERTLVCIRDFVQDMARAKWVNRILSKSSIEVALDDFNYALEESARAFQIASLIEIHHAVGSLQAGSSSTDGADRKAIEAPKVAGELVMSPLAYEFDVAPATASGLVEVLEDDSTSSPSSPSEDKIARAALSAMTIPDKNTAVDTCITPTEKEDVITAEVDDFLTQLDGQDDEYGFRRYHQSEFRISKPIRKNVGWFSGMCQANIDGQKMLVKRYDGPKTQALSQWVKDVKMLRNMYHEHLPQIIGYSNGKTPVPFLLLAHVQPRDINTYMQTVLTTHNLAGCAVCILKMYRDINSAVQYVRNQQGLDEGQTQDFIEAATFIVDGDNNLLLGLPRARKGNWITARNYNLTESVVDLATKYLSDLERIGQSENAEISPELASKLRQLAPLVRSLLPNRADDPALEPALDALLDSLDTNDYKPQQPVSLSTLRALSLRRRTHEQYWRERAPVDEIRVGDFGVKPPGADFSAFERLGNVFDAARGGSGLSVLKETSGTQMRRVDGFSRREAISPFLLPGGLEGWPLAMMPQGEVTVFVWRQTRFDSVNDAWQYLLDNARGLATDHSVKPDELLLVTRTTVDHNVTVKDWSARPLTHSRPGNPHFPGQPQGFGHHIAPRFGFGQAGPVPTIVYLVTSEQKDFEPHCTDDPMGSRRPRETRSTSWTSSCSTGWPAGHADYIQLDAEDVVN